MAERSISPAQPVATIFAGFLAFGTILGTWVVSLSQLKRHIGLSDGELGALLTTSALIALPAQFLAGAVLRRWGRVVFPTAATTLAVGYASVSFVDTPLPLFFLLPACAVCVGFLNISINAAALHHEHVRNTRLLSNMHAGFSVGGIPGVLLTGFAISASVSLQTIYLVLASVVLIAAVSLSNMTAGLEDDPEADKQVRFDPAVTRNRAIWAITVITMVAVIGEGTMYTWTAIYLRDVLHAPAFAGATATAAFFAAMAVGRFGAAPVQKRLQRLGTIRLAGALIVAGMCTALATRSIPLTIAGILVTGIAYAVCVPSAYSVAGSLAPGKSSAVSAFIAPMSAAASLMAPIIVGSIADATSLRYALGIEIVAGIVVVVGITAFRRSSLSAPITD